MHLCPRVNRLLDLCAHEIGRDRPDQRAEGRLGVGRIVQAVAAAKAVAAILGIAVAASLLAAFILPLLGLKRFLEERRA